MRSKEWTTEKESLFWINDPENEEFIKSKITELIKKKFEEEKILPPIPGIMRRECLESKNPFHAAVSIIFIMKFTKHGKKNQLIF